MKKIDRPEKNIERITKEGMPVRYQAVVERRTGKTGSAVKAAHRGPMREDIEAARRDLLALQAQYPCRPTGRRIHATAAEYADANRRRAQARMRRFRDAGICCRCYTNTVAPGLHLHHKLLVGWSICEDCKAKKGRQK